MHKRYGGAWLLLAVFLLHASIASAQTETGRITGVVRDATGAVLPGATVTAKGTATGITRTLQSDDAGQYLFANLPPGPYEVSAELASFRTQLAKVAVTVGANVSVDFRMELSGTAETVTVSGDRPAINTVNAELSTTVTETQIRELPTITRNVYDLVAIAGSVSGGRVDQGEEWTETTRGTG